MLDPAGRAQIEIRLVYREAQPLLLAFPVYPLVAHVAAYPLGSLPILVSHVDVITVAAEHVLVVSNPAAIAQRDRRVAALGYPAIPPAVGPCGLAVHAPLLSCFLFVGRTV